MTVPPPPAGRVLFTGDLVDTEATEALGRRLAGLLRAGDLLVLTGPLGAGKTTLTRGLGAGLRVRGQVASPTFVLARTHPSAVGRAARARRRLPSRRSGRARRPRPRLRGLGRRGRVGRRAARRRGRVVARRRDRAADRRRLDRRGPRPRRRRHGRGWRRGRPRPRRRARRAEAPHCDGARAAVAGRAGPAPLTGGRAARC